MSAADELPPLTDDEAVREVAWVARRARELVFRRPWSEPTPADYVEFFARKIRLLRHIGTRDALSLVPANVSLLEHYEHEERRRARACDECGEPVALGDECPECLAEDDSLTHDRCCTEGGGG